MSGGDFNLLAMVFRTRLTPFASGTFWLCKRSRRAQRSHRRQNGSPAAVRPRAFVDSRFQCPMIEITLPDGSQRSYDHPVTVAEVAASIGSGWLCMLAGRVDGKLVDTSLPHRAPGPRFLIVTAKDADGL